MTVLERAGEGPLGRDGPGSVCGWTMRLGALVAVASGLLAAVGVVFLPWWAAVPVPTPNAIRIDGSATAPPDYSHLYSRMEYMHSGLSPHFFGTYTLVLAVIGVGLSGVLCAAPESFERRRLRKVGTAALMAHASCACLASIDALFHGPEMIEFTPGLQLENVFGVYWTLIASSLAAISAGVAWASLRPGVGSPEPHEA